MFRKAIVKEPSKSMVYGISTANLGVPDYQTALEQHRQYKKALEDYGLSVDVMEPDENYPDSVFIEDTAVLTPEFAVITNPGHYKRQGEIFAVEVKMRELYSSIYYIKSPGTMDGGDVMKCNGHFIVGQSARTNKEGIQQFREIVAGYGYEVTIVRLTSILHLKTGVTCLGEKQVLISADLKDNPVFEGFKKILVPEDESYAANSLEVNGKILIPKDFPKTRQLIEHSGFKTKSIDVSEFRKLDGGLTCLSLRI